MVELCAICGKPNVELHHLIGGTSNRQHSDDDALVIYLCPEHHRLGRNSVHENGTINRWSKMLGQSIYEGQKMAEGNTPQEARKLYRERYGKSYL